jgi:biotin-dependent carboxylase-like uncharacterized protein
MTLRILHPGQLALVQDLGRPGFAHLGVSTSGAADTFSLRLANRLVGNPDHAAALELTFVGGTFTTDRELTLAIAGAPAAITLHTRAGMLHELPGFTAFTLKTGETLRIGAIREGLRVYLAALGGIDSPPILGSRSTHLPSGLGGHQGRGLRSGDTLPVGVATHAAGRHHLNAHEVGSVVTRLRAQRLSVLPGPHAESFRAEDLESLASHSIFTISAAADRTGLRLAGAAPSLAPHLARITTEAAWHGCVQITPSGQPIILGPDAPPTGGYPIPFSIASASLPALGQRRPGDAIAFSLTSIDHARSTALDLQHFLDGLIPPATPLSP